MPRYVRAAINDLSEEPDDIRREMAEDVNTPIAALELLANDPEWDIRTMVANNPNTPVHVLEQLCTDDSWAVRSAVAGNLHTPIDTLITMAKDAHFVVRASVANNPNIPIDLLYTLADDPSGDTRMNVAKHPNTPWDILVKLGQDSIWEVRRQTFVAYEVEIGFAGMAGASEFMELYARPEVTKEELSDILTDNYIDLMDLLDIEETEYLGDEVWAITLNFNGFVGCDETYNIDCYSADEEDEAVDAAYEEAIYDFEIIDFKCIDPRCPNP